MTTDTAHRTDAPPNKRASRQWPWLRLLGGLLMALAAAVFLAWLSFPAWAPQLAQRVLPENWSLLTLKVDRPGFSGLHVRVLAARGLEAGIPLTITAENTTVPIDRSRVDIERLVLGITAASAAPEDKPFDLAQFSLPRLVFGAAIPTVRIDTLVLADQRTADGQTLSFRELVVGNEAEGLNLKTVIPQPAPLSSDVSLSLLMDGEKVDLTVTSADQPDMPLMSFVQEPDNTDPSQAIAELEWYWDLGILDMGQLAQMFNLSAVVLPTAPEGQVTGVIAFRGQERLRPERGELRVSGLALESRAADLKGSLNLEWALAGDKVIAQMQALAMNATLREEQVLLRLRDLLEQQGIKGLLTTNELSMSIDVPGTGPGITQTPEPLQAEIGLASPYPTIVTGNVAIEGAQQEAFELAFRLPRLSVLLSPGGATALGDVNLDAGGTFRLLHPITVISGEQTLGASGGSGAVSFNFSETSGAQTLDATLTGLSFDGVSLAQPGTAASMASLSLSGSLLQSDTLSFSGQVAGTNLVLASEDQPLAPPLLSASSFSMPLELDQPNDTDTEIRGPLVLSGVNLPVAAITADAVTLDMSPITLPRLDGKLRLLTTGLVADFDGLARSGMDLDLNGAVREGRYYQGDGELLLGYQATLPFEFAADLETTAGTVTFSKAALPVQGLAALARPAGITLPKNLGFDTGQLIIDGEVQSNASGISGALTVAGEDLGLSLGESSLEGLNFTTQLDLADVLQGDGAVTLGIARLAAGLDLIALSSDLAIDNADEFGARSLTAQLLGGMISIPSISLKSGQLQNAQIDWEGFDLERLLKFVDVNGLEGTGTMDARLPLVAEDDGPAIRNGTFSARGPGRLRYTSGAPAANIGLQALDNFEYRELSGTLNYGSNGGYTIGVELLGANPDLYGGYPIRFRLNLGGAMPALFRSLFITGDFEKGIIERLRSGEPLLEPETP